MEATPISVKPPSPAPAAPPAATLDPRDLPAHAAGGAELEPASMNQLAIAPDPKRQRVEEAADGNGCKHCACKKSRCLKLMDPWQSNVGEASQGQFPGANTGAFQTGEGSQGQFPGANTGAYQAAWNPYMYAYQPPGWIPPGFQPRGPNVAMNNPSGYATAPFQQAQTTDTSVQHSEPALEEVVAPTARTRPTKSVTRIKLGNFTPDEDKNIVKSWLAISCNPITSTGQKRDRMWQRIMERYNMRRGSNPVRTLRSIQSRWDTIKAEVTLFASYFADSTRENPSGMSDADKTTHAVSNFGDVEGRKFGYLHCWKLMKDAPKWKDASARDIATAARGEGFGEHTTTSTDTMQPAEAQSSPVRSGGQPRRPMGRDSAKAAKKKANTDAGSTSSAKYAARMQDLSLQKNNIMQDRFEEMQRNNDAMIQIEQSKLQFMCEQHEHEKRRYEEEKLKEEKKENERILSIDLDTCNPALRTYYEICQQEILERQAARRRRSEGP